MKHRLDHLLVKQGLVASRSQAESYIRLGEVKVNGQTITKPGYFVAANAKLQLGIKTQYVSRAALKLASVSQTLNLDFKHKVVLDVGSSTGGFTDYALQHGAERVTAIDVGTNQLHPKLRVDSRVEVSEKTDIRDFTPSTKFDMALIDVSFISLTLVLGKVSQLLAQNGQIVALLKPQFEAGKNQLNKGVVKNNLQRREILQKFEQWCRQHGLVISGKSDSAVSGEKGNLERFYVLGLEQLA